MEHCGPDARLFEGKDYVISVGIQQTADLRHLDEAVAKAEAAMRQDRQAYYDHNGRARQLEG